MRKTTCLDNKKFDDISKKIKKTVQYITRIIQAIDFKCSIQFVKRIVFNASKNKRFKQISNKVRRNEMLCSDRNYH